MRFIDRCLRTIPVGAAQSGSLEDGSRGANVYFTRLSPAGWMSRFGAATGVFSQTENGHCVNILFSVSLPAPTPFGSIKTKIWPGPIKGAKFMGTITPGHLPAVR